MLGESNDQGPYNLTFGESDYQSPNNVWVRKKKKKEKKKKKKKEKKKKKKKKKKKMCFIIC